MPHHRALDKVTERYLGDARIGTTGRGIGPTVPGLDVDAAVVVADEGRKTVLEWLVRAAVDGRAVLAVYVGEAGIEGRQEPPALAVRNRHRPSNRRVRRLVAARVERERGPCVVEPGDVGTDAWIGDLGPERREQDRWASVHQAPGLLPDSLTGQTMGENRPDGVRPGRRSRPEADLRQALQLRATLLRRVPGVVDVLGLVD